MKTTMYRKLQRNIIAATLVVSLAPLIFLGVTIYYQYSKMYKEKISQQIRYRARAQAESVDLFLKERTAILSGMADTHSFSNMTDEKYLSRIFQVMNTRAGAFVDLGVISNAGQQLAYIGPYELKGLNYYQQPWFAEVMSKGVHISDVYLGFRQLPHFIIAVRRQEGNFSWILRATIDSEIFQSFIRAAQIGKTGDAYIINRSGMYQTRPRFDGGILTQSDLSPALFGEGSTIIEKEGAREKKILYAGTWLKNDSWLLIIRQDPAEEMSGLFATRNAEIAIVLFGITAIVLTAVLTTRTTVNRLRASEAKMNELNAQLVQTDKLAALGKLAAGVAHEINNPLAVIIQKTGWMEDLLTEEDFQKAKNLEEFKTSIRKIEEHVERARKVVHNMLGYARGMEPRHESVDVNEALNRTISILENYARINNIEIQTDNDESIGLIASDQSQLQQVFMNLISNAIDAIGKDGLISIRTERDGNRIRVHITDNGPGIPEAQQKRVFDPFFTTKETGKGTGLGLWISYNIMEKLGGTIILKSRQGEGATFTVEIPATAPGEE